MSAPQFVLAHIEEITAIDPDRPLIVEADGVTVTYADASRDIRTWSRWLRLESRMRRVRIAALLDNTAVPHLLRVAAADAGVVYTALNPMLRGKSLVDALDRSGITDVVVSDAAAPDQFGLSDPDRHSHLPVVHIADAGHIVFSDDDCEPREGAAAEDWPRPCHTLVYTSGTSGPSKPVRIPAESMAMYGRLLFGSRAESWSAGGYYSPWHPAHILGAVGLEAAVTRGLTLVLRRKFDLDAFWTDIVDHGCRMTVLISVASSLLSRRDLAPDDHPLKIVGVSPVLSDYRAFETAFGVEIVSIYGMTELGTVLTAAAPEDRRFVGKPSPPYRCRVEPLRERPDVAGVRPGDQIGELLVSPIGPQSSYEPGLELLGGWKDGWFHTGDIVVEHEGAYRFVGRAKDTIRRHGRNISAHDLEDEVRSLAGVCDCVCVGYPDLDSIDCGNVEDEIRLFVLPSTPDSIDAARLVDNLAERVPRYMIPRYIDVVEDFPRTASGKLSRRALREQPLTAATYDRKPAGTRD